MAVNIQSGLDWGNRMPGDFIDTIITQSSFLNRLHLVDGVKSKVNVPIFGFSPVFHNDFCNFDPKSNASLDEKEMTVTDWKADFQNCKGVLESEWRSVLLRKGALTEETLDEEFGNWVFDRFAKETAKKLITESATTLTTAIDSGPDEADVLKATISAITKANVLDALETGYDTMSDSLLEASYGDADREYAPIILMGSAAIRSYNQAVAGQINSYDVSLQASGNMLPYFGMEVVHYPSLGANRVWICNPTNLVFLTDGIGDDQAINSEYEAKTNTLNVWAQFRAGFDFRLGEEIVALYTS